MPILPQIQRVGCPGARSGGVGDAKKSQLLRPGGRAEVRHAGIIAND